jgi:homoserine O-acetyltransferase
MSFHFFGFWITLLLSATSMAEQQYVNIGDLEMRSGEVLENCSVGYRTYGELNADKSNVLVFPTWFTGTTEILVEFEKIGPGKLADTSRYFVIAIDALGNGVSSSPSNTENFPHLSTVDMVQSQYRLLTEHFNLTHVNSVLGISMGGMQAFRWLEMYPNFMDAVIPIDASPKMTSYDLLQWNTHGDVARKMVASGHSDAETLGLISDISLLTLFTPEYFVDQVSPDNLADFLDEQKQGYLKLTVADYLAQSEAMIGHDVFDKNGDFPIKEESAPRVLVIGVPTDHMVNQTPAREVAAQIGAEYLSVNNYCGHLGTTCDETIVVAKVAEFLSAE